MKPTHEQQQAIDKFASGGDLKVIAYAGAGKTSTLTAMGAVNRYRPGLYIAFNRAIVQEAQAKFRGTRVAVKTAHSLAYQHCRGMGYSDDKMRSNLNSRSCGRIEKWEDVSYVTVSQLVLGTIRRFCQSADDRISSRHVPRPAKPIDGELPGEPPSDKWQACKTHVVKLATEIWYKAVDVETETPLGHDGYLKLWALQRPRLHQIYNFLMIDEAQDLNPVLIDVIARQQGMLQLVSVGDPHQQIYAWRGAVDALKTLPGEQARLTQSFRFGAAIASFANRLLSAMGETYPLTGTTAPSFVSPPDFSTSAVLCRTNTGVIDNVVAALVRGDPTHIVGGTRELQALVEDAQRLLAGQPARGVELLGFESWKELLTFIAQEDNQSLQVFVNLVERYGAETLLDTLAHVQQTAAPGTTIISTAHKAKGLEFSDVEIHSDFAREKPNLEERRLFYVATTRAKTELAIDSEIARSFFEPLGILDDNG